jgi:hypothetical protein
MGADEWLRLLLSRIAATYVPAPVPCDIHPLSAHTGAEFGGPVPAEKRTQKMVGKLVNDCLF